MLRRIAADLRHQLVDASLEEAGLDELLRIGVNRHFLPELLDAPDAADQVVDVDDRPVGDRAEDPGGVLSELRGHEEPQLQIQAIAEMDRDPVLPVRPGEGGRREPALRFLQDVEDVLAGAEGVDAEVWTGAVRLAGLTASQGDAVGLPERAFVTM